MPVAWGAHRIRRNRLSLGTSPGCPENPTGEVDKGDDNSHTSTVIAYDQTFQGQTSPGVDITIRRGGIEKGPTALFRHIAGSGRSV